MGRRSTPAISRAAPSVPRATVVAGAIAVGWAALILGLHFKKYSFQGLALSEIIDRVSFARWGGLPAAASAVVLGAGVLFAAWGLGHSLLRRWKIPWHSPLEEAVFGWGLGQGVLAYVLLAVGALQGYRPAVLWGLYLSALAWAFYQWRVGGLRRLCRDAWTQARARPDGARGDGLLRVLLWSAFALNGVMCFVPEVFYDALVYHLGVPRWYLLEGGIRYYPAYHAQFPLTRQMINLFGLALQGESLAKLLHFATSVQIHCTFLALAEIALIARPDVIGRFARSCRAVVARCTSAHGIGMAKGLGRRPGRRGVAAFTFVGRRKVGCVLTRCGRAVVAA